MDENLKNALCKQIYLLALHTRQRDNRHRALSRLQLFLADLKGSPLTYEDVQYTLKLDHELGELGVPDLVMRYDVIIDDSLIQ